MRMLIVDYQMLIMLLYLRAAYLALVHLSGLPRTHRTRLSELADYWWGYQLWWQWRCRFSSFGWLRMKERGNSESTHILRLNYMVQPVLVNEKFEHEWLVSMYLFIERKLRLECFENAKLFHARHPASRTGSKCNRFCCSDLFSLLWLNSNSNNSNDNNKNNNNNNNNNKKQQQKHQWQHKPS